MDTPDPNYLDTFDPAQYLSKFYAEPDPEDRFVIKFMADVLPTMQPNLLTLELGGGPTLFAVAALAPYAREIHFCDFVPANLAEVRRWLDNDPSAFNWYPYIEMVLQEEGRPFTEGDIQQRAAEMRRKVTRLLTCDAAAPDPLGQQQTRYDLVVAQASTDVVADTVAGWMAVIRNVTQTLVAPGGWLLISVITGTSGYTVGQERFRCLHLTQDDIYHGYVAAGYDPDSFQLEHLQTSTERDYSGITTAVAQKV